MVMTGDDSDYGVRRKKCPFFEDGHCMVDFLIKWGNISSNTALAKEFATAFPKTPLWESFWL